MNNPNSRALTPPSRLAVNSGQRLKQTYDPILGTVVNGEYALLEIVGEGGMAKVYKAKQLSVDRFVALKLLTTDEPDAIARFASEVKIHGRLKHKNIVQALDCIRDSKTGKTIFVMEYLDGLTLGQVIKDRETGINCEPEVFSIVSQLCDALEHAHNKGVIHRDLKPNNIVLLQGHDSLIIKVVDFGIARVQEDMQRLTQAGVVVGSPGYMSPEQCKGKEPDRRADVYSLGAILFALLTGRVPYPEPDLRSMMLAHCDTNRQPPPIEEFCGAIRGAKLLNEIIAKAMEKNRSNRFQSASELKQAIIFWYGCVLDDNTKLDLPEIFQTSDRTLEKAISTSQQRSLRELVDNHPSTLPKEQWKPPELFVTGTHKNFEGQSTHSFSQEKFETISLSTPLVGRVLENRYRVLDVIGEGGMSIVYSAVNLRTNEIVAVKTLKFAETHLAERFVREMQIHSTLKHPNIVRAIECIETKAGQSYFVMELLKGVVLEHYLNSEGRLDDIGDICLILAQLLNAVEYAHDKGLVHRDLKPGNIIMFEQNGELQIKVLDFGVAKIQEDLQRLTKTGVIIGSPAYMSPEQCIGNDVDPISDIYSLGFVLYEMVTGRMPYDNVSTELDWMETHCDPSRQPIPVSVYRPGLPECATFNSIVLKAIEKNKTLRYQTIEELKRDLGKWWQLVNKAEEECESPFSFDRRKTERINSALLANVLNQPLASEVAGGTADSETDSATTEGANRREGAGGRERVARSLEAAEKIGAEGTKADSVKNAAKPTGTQSGLNAILGPNQDLRSHLNIWLALLILILIGTVAFLTIQFQSEGTTEIKNASGSDEQADHPFSVLEVEPILPAKPSAESSSKVRIIAPGTFRQP